MAATRGRIKRWLINFLGDVWFLFCRLFKLAASDDTFMWLTIGLSVRYANVPIFRMARLRVREAYRFILCVRRSFRVYPHRLSLRYKSGFVLNGDLHDTRAVSRNLFAPAVPVCEYWTCERILRGIFPMFYALVV